jgi:RNA polymerase sigma-70 factor (ECF subfamily)
MRTLPFMDEGLSAKFQGIFTENYKSLCRIAYSLTGDLDVSKDLVQDVFYKLWGRREKLTFDSGIEHYLRQATTHAAYNFIKQKRNRASILSQIDWLARPTPAENAQSITFTELEKEAQIAIQNLPPKCKAIFLLSRREELKYQEIADHLNISVKTVEHQMGIALHRLRDHLRPYLTKDYLIPVVIAVLLYLASKILM